MSKPPVQLDQYVGVREGAAILGVGRSTLYLWCTQNRLGTLWNERWWIRRTELDAFHRYLISRERTRKGSGARLVNLRYDRS